MKAGMVVLIAITICSLVLTGCDSGRPYGVPFGAKIKVSIEREQLGTNPSLLVFASGMQRTKSAKGDTLVFAPPCYLGENTWDGDNRNFSIVCLTEDQPFRLAILPGAVTSVRVEDITD